MDKVHNPAVHIRRLHISRPHSANDPRQHAGGAAERTMFAPRAPRGWRVCRANAHAFKNASIPVVTIIGIGIAGLVSGLVVTEAIFAIPGVGRLIVDAVTRRDYPVIQGVILMVTVAYVLINLVVDLIYGYLDPRIRY